MYELVSGLQWWHWWIAAAVLGLIEALMPGAVAIWFAASAAVIGSLLLIIPIPWLISWYTRWYVSQFELVERG